jgi:lysophospholipase L1-like esterase
MKKRLGLIALILLGVVSIATAGFALVRTPEAQDESASTGTSIPPPATAKPWAPVALMFGDSYFNGWEGVPQDRALGATTARKLGYFPIVRGAGATGYVTARDGSKQGTPVGSFLDQVAKHPLRTPQPAAIVVLEGGLADLSVPEPTFADGMRKMIKIVKEQQPSAKIFVLGPPNITDRVIKSEHDRIQAGIAAEEAVSYISFSELMPDDELRSLIGPDKTHPSAAGKDLIAERLAAALTNRGVMNPATAKTSS